MSVDYDSKVRGFMEHIGAGDYLLKPDASSQKYIETIDRILNDHEVNLHAEVISIRNKIMAHAGAIRDIMITWQPSILLCS